MKPYVYDCETSINNRGEGAVGDLAASPYCTENKVVCWGIGSSHAGEFSVNVLKGEPYAFPAFLTGEDDVVVVGSNIGFDLQYIRKTWPKQWQDAKKHIYIWDCQQVEYLLSGHTHIYPSLDQMCEKYGFPLKDDRLKAYWEAGVATEAIPEEVLHPYQQHDVEATYFVFRKQLEILKSNPKLFNLVKVKMEDILATVEMEWNGMRFDLLHAYSLREEASILREETANALHALALTHGWPAEVTLNLNSSDHVGAFLFGGTVSYEGVEYLGVKYKTGAKAGQEKSRKCIKTVELKGVWTPVNPSIWKTPTGKWKVDDEVLEALERYVAFAKHLLVYRRLDKDISTYYEGYSKLVWPDDMIHPSINHSATVTGRQSCTKPNLQNVTRAEE